MHEFTDFAVMFLQNYCNTLLQGMRLPHTETCPLLNHKRKQKNTKGGM